MFVNRIRIRVEFGDCDPGHIVFYANYFRWFDRCTSALFRAAGMEVQQLFKSHGVLGIPLVDARARFFIPSTYGDELDAESCVTKWGTSSFEISHRFFRDGQLAMEGSETHVWAMVHPTEPNRLKSVPLPKDVIKKLSTPKKRQRNS
jgi:4-hydroxybenzoyl-CoA thioesterase